MLRINCNLDLIFLQINLIREPLATTINRNYNLPEEAKDAKFSYGQKTIPNNITTTEYFFYKCLKLKKLLRKKLFENG